MNRKLARRGERRLAAMLAAGTVLLASLPTAGFALGVLDGHGVPPSGPAGTPASTSFRRNNARA